MAIKSVEAPTTGKLNSPDQLNEQYREELLRPIPRFTVGRFLTWFTILVIFWWGIRGTDFDFNELYEGRFNIADFADRLFDFTYITIDTSDRPALANLAAIESVDLRREIDELSFMQRIERVTIGLFLGADENGNLEIEGPDFTVVELPLMETIEDIPILSWFLPAEAEWTWWIPEAIPAIIETFQMALIGTALAIVLSLPIGALAARNISPAPWIYQTVRMLLNINRTIPELIWALIFVAAVGLGPFGGVMALAVGAIGFLAKVYAEAIESIDPQQVMAIRATGATPVLAFIFGVVPQAAPLIASYSILAFESNVRAASILGIVGAGGIGFIIQKYMALFQYSRLMGAVIIMIVMVTLLDRASDWIRSKLI